MAKTGRSLTQLAKGFQTWKITGKASRHVRRLLADIDDVLEEYRADLPLTVRQVFYRLVADKGFDKAKYAYLDNNLSLARRAGYVDWRILRDDSRSVIEADKGWSSAEWFIKAHRPNPDRFTKRLLDNQPYYIEVHCEAAGMIHQLASVVNKKGINVLASGGQGSVTQKWDFYQRIRAISAERPVVILHLGDRDLAGETIFEILRDELLIVRAQETDDEHHWQELVETGWGSDLIAKARKDRHDPKFEDWIATFDERDVCDPWSNPIYFVRVAVTDQQIDDHHLTWKPPKDAKSKEPPRQVQLEAMTPDQIRAALREAVDEWWDEDAEVATQAIIKQERKKIVAWVDESWPD